MSARSRISPPAGSNRDRHEIARYLENWQDEIESAYLDRALAKAEKQPALAEVYNRLALTEQSHAQVWEEKLIAARYRIPKRRIGWRTKALAQFARLARSSCCLY
jgi:vacuolar iron transporter family protein